MAIVKRTNIPTLNQNDEKRFWGKIDITANDDKCWNWNRSNVAGYGAFRINHYTYRANRIAFAIANNIYNFSLHVCHSCDNPSCCNPKHLFLGTESDNSNDRDKKGRCAKGENHYASTLNEKQVKEIRELYESGKLNGRELAIKFGSTDNNIYAIIHKKSWKHVD